MQNAQPRTTNPTRHLSMKDALKVLCDFGDYYAACLEAGPSPTKLSEEMNSLTARLLETLTGKEPSHGDLFHVMPFGD